MNLVLLFGDHKPMTIELPVIPRVGEQIYGGDLPHGYGVVVKAVRYPLQRRHSGPLHVAELIVSRA